MNEDDKITTTYTRGSWKRRVTDEDIKGHLDTALLMDNLVKAEMVSVKINTPMDFEINETVDRMLGDSDLITRINELVIEDTNERYIRELINRNKELEAEVKEANENASWWKSRYEGSRKMLKSTNICYGLTGVEAKMYKHTVAAINQHRLNTANEYIESRKENMLPEHYNDLKYILNECDLESGW